MTAVMTYAEAARIVREDAPVKNKAYRQFPIGQEAGRFLRAKRVERDVRPNTVDSYEGVLAKLALHYPYLELEAFTERGRGPELLIDFLDHYWGDASLETRRHRMAVLASFFEWAYRHDRVTSDPMRKIARPKKKRGARRERVPDTHVRQLVSAQPWLRDQAAVLLLGRLALRREDLRLLQLGDIDLGRDEIHLRHAKGGEEHTLPAAFPDVRETLYLHLQSRDGHPDEYLVYPRSHRRRPFSPAGIDYWFRLCVARAGLTGYTMHQLRHAAIDQIQRDTRDPESARQLARHRHLATTQEYLHSNLEDLRAAIEAMGGTGV